MFNSINIEIYKHSGKGSGSMEEEKDEVNIQLIASDSKHFFINGMLSFLGTVQPDAMLCVVQSFVNRKWLFVENNDTGLPCHLLYDIHIVYVILVCMFLVVFMPTATHI